LLEAAPDCIDVYFDKVGGEHLEAALTAARSHGRFALCGGISNYNVSQAEQGICGMMQAIGKFLRLEDYLVETYFDKSPIFRDELSRWITEDKFKLVETVDEGIENATTAFMKLFSGGDLGKTLVRLGASEAK
jgi:NADPH-dependent curcumin reductase CurA